MQELLPSIFFAWPLSVAMLWAELLLPAADTPDHRATRSVGWLLFAVPPTMLLFPFMLLLVASPTAQMNTWDVSMKLWSFWVKTWQPCLILSYVFCSVYTLSAAALLPSAKTRRFACAAIFASVSSGIAAIVLSHAYSTA